MFLGLARRLISSAQWCHKSGYDGVSCAKAKAAKRYLWNRCAKKAVSDFDDLMFACAC